MNGMNVARWIGWSLASAFVGLGAASCALPTGFSCINSNQCGGGQCIAGGCAFPSGDCPSGLRYGALSPEPLAGECVGVDEGVADGSDSAASTTLDTGTSTSAGSESESSTTESSTTESSTTESSTTDSGATTGVIPDTVIAHYSFDQIAAPTIFDASGNGFDAEMGNAQSSAPGVVGEGLGFGNLDRVIVPAAVLADHPDFTIEFYMQVSQSAVLRQFLVYYGDEVDTASVPLLTFYVEYANAPVQTSRAVWTDANDTVTGLIGTTTVAGGEWHHIALTFSSNQGMSLYVDHFLDDEDPQIAGLFNPNLGWIQIGGIPTGFGSFNGTLDELRFSDGVLTPDQMQPAP